MKQFKSAVFIILLVPLLLFPKLAFAHEAESDGSFEALIHVSPNDTPVAGSKSNISIELTDDTNRFDPSNCDCVVDIYQGNTNILSKNVTFTKSRGPFKTNFDYVFPDPGAYHVRLSGKPAKGAEFKEFSINFDATDAEKPNNNSDFISPTPTTNTSPTPTNLVLIGGIGIVLIAIIFLMSKKKKRS
ncbi:MAG TPA: LPXTG cell wall anchor domain-containing protein [Patescibacteria group bacterium]|nr:LPXTG cell wall anchor domain-containing protein [Patescibacteria group bacterium]